MPSRLAKLAISSRSAPQGNEWELHAAPEDEHVILLWNSQVKVHPLPVVLFPGGHVAFVQRSPWRWGQRVAGRRAAIVGLLSTTPSRALGGGQQVGVALPAHTACQRLPCSTTSPPYRSTPHPHCRRKQLPYVVHATFQRYPTDFSLYGKRGRFRCAGSQAAGWSCSAHRAEHRSMGGWLPGSQPNPAGACKITTTATKAER